MLADQPGEPLADPVDLVDADRADPLEGLLAGPEPPLRVEGEPDPGAPEQLLVVLGLVEEVAAAGLQVDDDVGAGALGGLHPREQPPHRRAVGVGPVLAPGPGRHGGDELERRDDRGVGEPAVLAGEVRRPGDRLGGRLLAEHAEGCRAGVAVERDHPPAREREQAAARQLLGVPHGADPSGEQVGVVDARRRPRAPDPSPARSASKDAEERRGSLCPNEIRSAPTASSVASTTGGTEAPGRAGRRRPWAAGRWGSPDRSARASRSVDGTTSRPAAPSEPASGAGVPTRTTVRTRSRSSSAASCGPATSRGSPRRRAVAVPASTSSALVATTTTPAPSRRARVAATDCSWGGAAASTVPARASAAGTTAATGVEGSSRPASLTPLTSAPTRAAPRPTSTPRPRQRARPSPRRARRRSGGRCGGGVRQSRRAH